MSGVYPPSEDTYLLLRNALREVRREDRVLEVGCGSGKISEELSKVAREVFATEINPYSARFAHERGVEVILTDLTRGIKGEFDLILFNPPYLPEKATDLESLAWAGGEGGIEVAKRFIDEAQRLLSERGRILLVLSSLSEISEFLEHAKRTGFEVEVIDEERLFFERLYVLRLEPRKSI
ncbi:MAG: release factor glutamine methyltransferase [Archaeoglobi archaeon]|nr:methyltransferase [Candidatus Mnemosynella bozhongmuii]MDK2782106.1 release factor glutamine methyltransferase [Archaeoglobi archaeon]